MITDNDDSSSDNDDDSIVVLYVPTADDMQDVGGVLASLLLEKEENVDNHDDVVVTAFSASPTLILMNGDLGAGKTCLTRGFVRTLTTGNDDDDTSMLRVTSPTFLLVNTYPTSILLRLLRERESDSDKDDEMIEKQKSTIEIRHLDLYRLSGTSPRDFEPLDLDHVFTKCIALMEWPERLGNHVGALPDERLEICITIIADDDKNEKRESTSLSSSQDMESVNNENLSWDNIGEEEEDTNHLRRVVLHPVGNVWKNRLQRMVQEGYVDDLLECVVDEEDDNDDD
jgi:tRNA A37 threonylcarbamoyladenosine biosynthesis protein TsaE